MSYIISIFSKHVQELHWSKPFPGMPTDDQIHAECLKFIKEHIKAPRDSVHVHWYISDDDLDPISQGTTRIRPSMIGD